jgi:hypothetical protein
MISNGINAVNRKAGKPFTGQPMVKRMPEIQDNMIRWNFFISELTKVAQRY